MTATASWSIDTTTPGATLESLIRARMQADPDRPAVMDDHVELSYGELDARVDTIAAALERSGVGRGDLVAVCLSRNVDLVAGLLAVHRVGAAYVPLDPDYPADRLDFMVDDSRPRAVLADPATISLARRFADDGRVVLDLSTLPEGVPLAARAPEPEDIAYVIYTSGSTGRPKGVMLEHRNTVGMLEWIHQEFTADDLAGVLLSTSICFDLSVFEVFGTLSGGGTIVVSRNGLALPELANKHRVTLLNTVPGVTAALVRAGELPSSVRIVIHSGDTTSRALADAVHAVPTVERLYNLYGPTEVVTWQIGCLVDRGVDDEIPMGTVFPGVGVHVLDPEGRPVADGEMGELHLSGRQVSRGYLRRPELTAERFVERPDLADGRCYATGDLVIRRPADGVLLYRGRADFQVKVRGFRIELGEIESALERHPAVEDCVVVAQSPDHDGGERRIVAHVQIASLADELGIVPGADGVHHGAELDALQSELTALIGRFLPDYMVPSAFCFLQTLPTTPNGKPDRAALPRVQTSVADGIGRDLRTEQEHVVAAIWREVLGASSVTRIPADVQFSVLGGDSLQMAGVTARLRQRHGLAITLQEFQSTPTVEALAALLEGMPGGVMSSASVPHLDSAVPMNDTLQETWLGDQVAGSDMASWTVTVEIDVTGPLPTAALQRSLDSLVVRHSALRTAVVDAETVTVIEPYAVALREVDLYDVSPELEAAAARTENRQLAETPIDLASGRLLSAQVIRLEADHARLVLHVHHSGFDGLSFRPLVTDLAALLDAETDGVAPPAAPRLTDADARRYLLQQRHETSAGRDAYWRRRLADGPPAVATPAGQGAGDAGTWDGGKVEVAVDPTVAERLRQHLRSPASDGSFALVLAACAVRAHRETGATDLVINAPIATRDHPDLEDVVGLLHDVMPIRIDLTGDPTFAELQGRIADAVAADREAGAPDRAHRDLARAAGDPRIRPSVLIVAMQRGEPAIRSVARTFTYRSELGNGGAKSDLTVFWELDMPTPQVAAEFALQRYTEDDARRFLGQVLDIALAGIDGPDLPVSRLPLVNGEALDALVRWSGALDVDSQAPPVVASIIEQAGRTPGATAVRCRRAGDVTYSQLLAGARRVAAALPPLDPSVPVAVAGRREARSIAAMLGVWLRGAGYLPIDVTHPVVRLADVLDDSLVQVLVADESCPDLPAPTRLDLTAILAGSPADWERAADSVEPSLDVPEAAAYRIYTSGSTGRPKGVTVSRRAFATFLSAMAEVVPLTGTDEVAFVTTPSFDISGLEMWLPLVSGASLRVIDEDTVRDGQALAAALDGVTVVQLTPTGWRILLAGGWAGDHRVRALAGGEPLPPALAADLVGRVSELWNVYGPTEATVWATACRIGAEPGGAVPIGRPLRNTVVHVVDAGGQLLPPGAVGEIVIGGYGLADGYHDRPELTAAAFVDVPGLPLGSAGTRCYRTGDLGRWTPDGMLQCLGRRDGQVKVRGVRIELGEIEAVISRSPGVAACAVVVDGSDMHARLVAHLVLEPGTTTESLADVARVHLPDGYLPDVWLQHDALPVTAAGKVDRKALLVPESLQGEFYPPEGETEELVAEIWSEVLEIDRIDRNDSLLALGGHSLSATRVAALLRADLELAVSVRMVFDHPRLRDFAAAVDELLEAEPA